MAEAAVESTTKKPTKPAILLMPEEFREDMPFEEMIAACKLNRLFLSLFTDAHVDELVAALKKNEPEKYKDTSRDETFIDAMKPYLCFPGDGLSIAEQIKWDSASQKELISAYGKCLDGKNDMIKIVDGPALRVALKSGTPGVEAFIAANPLKNDSGMYFALMERTREYSYQSKREYMRLISQ